MKIYVGVSKETAEAYCKFAPYISVVENRYTVDELQVQE